MPVRRFFWPAGALAGVLACTTGPNAPNGAGVLEPRYLAVHNALSAMGLAQVGPIQRGALAEGREMRFSADLPSECATIVAIANGDVRDVDLTVFDADDKTLGKDLTTASEAVVKVCPPHGGRFSFVVKMAKGGGDFVLASWSGGALGPAAATANANTEPPGTCEAPIPLLAGTVTGNTRRGNAENAANNCGNSEGKELVYKLELDKRARVLVDVDPTFDSVLYIRKDDCTDADAQVACNDDANADSSGKTTHASRLEEVLEPGTYYVFVDGYQAQLGNFKMKVEVSDVPTVADECRSPTPLVQRAQGTLTGNYDGVKASCGAIGPEVPYRLDLPARARTRITIHSDDLSPAVHVRRSCADESTELACSESGMKSTDVALATTLDAGQYTVFADSSDKAQRGKYTVDVELTPDGGKGVRGDACADAIPLPADDKPIDGDTFDAHDDFSGSCAGKNAPDTMYRFELTARSRVTAQIDAEEGAHVFTLLKTCTDKASELACATRIDEMLNPGVYFLAVDGTDKGAFGKYRFRLRAKDVTAQETACKTAPAIALGQTVQGTTAGAKDAFAVSCGGRVESQASGDRVFRLVNPTRQRIQLMLTTPNHDGAIALRKACLDPPGMKQLRDAEQTCNNDFGDTRHSKIETLVEPGTYFVVVDGHQGKNEGPFTLEARVQK